jgi:ectoine hydroxylase-related dioxygenase (phytanoyl-CoA dioxygenase family)
MLSAEQVAFYHEEGYLHIPEVFSADEVAAMSADLDYLIERWAVRDQGWTGPWRRQLMDADTESKSELIHLHDLQFYSEPWLHAVTKPLLAQAMEELLGAAVELHHSTLHIKPPETGHPFPLHQDMAFYPHADDRFVDVLVHLDDTRHENGEIRFLAGSHKLGYLPHITETPAGPCTPHLPQDVYRLADTVPVPARRGDVVCFNVNTVHGSHINTTDRMRRLVRVGYRHPDNQQLGGQSVGRPGLMVRGLRRRTTEAGVLTNAAV